MPTDEEYDAMFAVRVKHEADWTIEPKPVFGGVTWQSNARAVRTPMEDGDDEGDTFEFPHLGEFETQEAAANYAVTWVTNWIETNY